MLNNDGKTIQVKHQSISKKKDSRHAVALDSDNNNLQVKDIVKVIDGAHAVSYDRMPFIRQCAAYQTVVTVTLLLFLLLYTFPMNLMYN